MTIPVGYPKTPGAPTSGHSPQPLLNQLVRPRRSVALVAQASPTSRAHREAHRHQHPHAKPTGDCRRFGFRFGGEVSGTQGHWSDSGNCLVPNRYGGAFFGYLERF